MSVKFLLVFLDMNVYIFVLYAVILLFDLGEQPFKLRSFSLHHHVIAADCRSHQLSNLLRKLGSRSIYRLLRLIEA